MLTHIVCFEFRAGHGWDDPGVQAAERISRDHPQHVPDILTWMVGRNCTERERSFDFAVVGQFSDRSALDRYLVHPDHQRGVTAWAPLSTWVVVDLDHADLNFELHTSARYASFS